VVQRLSAQFRMQEKRHKHRPYRYDFFAV